MSRVVDGVGTLAESRPKIAAYHSIDLTASFADFHSRALAGEALSVVFFGGSITWGAGASDPWSTSYRALIGKRLSETYPNARFAFHDAAIGGTTSQLGAFRLERDVMSRQPDIVFLDFALNDGMDEAHRGRLSSYEALMRKIILEAHAPVVLPLFPSWDIVAPGFNRPVPGLDARIDLAEAYRAPLGDAIGYVRKQIAEDVVALEDVWPNPADHTHPGDKGYELYAEAVWRAFEAAVRQEVVCTAPAEMLYGDAYMSPHRYVLADLSNLPTGWHAAPPSNESPVYDMKMSRWLDSVVVTRRDETANSAIGPLRIEADARVVLVFGESTLRSGRYEVAIDGEPGRIVDAGETARIIGGDARHFDVISEALAPGQMHVITITPMLEPGQELRFESICLSGGMSNAATFNHLAAANADGSY